MKKNMNRIGILILMGIFLLFYVTATYFLDRRNLTKEAPQKEVPEKTEVVNYEAQESIVKDLYNDIKILYDVVNNKFVVNNDYTINIGDNVYKKITNFNDVMDSVFTQKGIENYLNNLSNYFAYTEDGYYLIGNLVNYQTYYFRGDETNIYVTNAQDDEIDAIIYERWTTNNKNTLATIRVVMEEGKWLVDDIKILKSE